MNPVSFVVGRSRRQKLFNRMMLFHIYVHNHHKSGAHTMTYSDIQCCYCQWYLFCPFILLVDMNYLGHQVHTRGSDKELFQLHSQPCQKTSARIPSAKKLCFYHFNVRIVSPRIAVRQSPLYGQPDPCQNLGGHLHPAGFTWIGALCGEI